MGHVAFVGIAELSVNLGLKLYKPKSCQLLAIIFFNHVPVGKTPMLQFRPQKPCQYTVQAGGGCRAAGEG